MFVTCDPVCTFSFTVNFSSCPARPAVGSWTCPSGAAACEKVEDKYVSLGGVSSGPVWDGNVLKLQYTGGQTCPDGKRRKSSIIRFQCDKDKVVRERRSPGFM